MNKGAFLTGITLSFAFAFVGLIEHSSAQESLVSKLKQGGYVVYFRHAQASNEARPNPQSPTSTKNCKGDRHITPEGVTTSTSVGDSLRKLEIPIGKIISSPACTAVETIWYVLKKDTFEVVPSLDGNPRDQIWTDLRPFLITAPAKGTNTALFAHSTNIKALMGLVIAEGEAVIFQPDGQGGFTFIGRLKPNEWK